MKNSFNSLDVACVVFELQKLIGMRVAQVYDVDHKTYLFKLQKGEEKQVLLLESGVRMHITNFDWPKGTFPSGFTMKLRKHLRNKRIESIQQLRNDRIVDFQFGSGEAAYHVILELFNRGNIILTDNTLKIINVLRPHKEGDLFKFAVKEEYPTTRARQIQKPDNVEELINMLEHEKKGDKILKILICNLDYGSALTEHIMVTAGLNKNMKFTENIEIDVYKNLVEKLSIGDEVTKEIKTTQSKGYIILKKEIREGKEDLITFLEFHPYLFIQHLSEPYKEFASFNEAVDEFYSKIEGQKVELRTHQMEEEVLSRVEKIKVDQEQRIQSLISDQERARNKADLIMGNSELVDEVIFTVRLTIAHQMSWPDIIELFKKLSKEGNIVATTIKQFKFEIDHVTLSLSDPFNENSEPELIDIDLGLSACANASRYYSNKKTAAEKERKTMESQDKALKSAERKAKETLKNLHLMRSVTKSRKAYWFEKFYWFISSDNLLVIGGRDQQQNELIVKRYLKKGDVYVHADLHGSSSIIIKNPTGLPVPPRTLNEAGNMAVCYSVGWEAKVLCSAWWVHYDQVSKTAPSGEYLTTGSFMVRGQKNYLLPAQLAMGLAFLFKIDESSLHRHQGERKPKAILEDTTDVLSASTEINRINNLSIISNANGDEKVDTEQENVLEKELTNDENQITYIAGFPNADIHLSKELGKLSGFPEFIENRDESSESTIDPSVSKTSVDDSSITSFDDKNSEKDDKKVLKRGQKSRLKKMKEKYKNQDEEEKQLRMSILQSAGPVNETKKKKKKGDKVDQKEVTKPKKLSQKNPISQPVKETVEYSTEFGDVDEVGNVDLDIIDLLTGQPQVEDDLLYALPVVAPYSSVLNYKFKVKLIPGTGKRGKCSRSALDYFTRLKDCTVQEKTLMKSIDDQLISRNIPGKVKLSTPTIKK